ncbi:MAG: FliH/SctL family protein [Verrucomicrobiota bacterium JB022]|nr:FliH/SctL family protein [Verrucomicrobiota bacterium JB022]
MSSSSVHHFDLRLSRPVRAVQFVRFGPPPVDADVHEKAVAEAYERGKRAAEQNFHAQMSSQREDVLDFQRNVLERLEREVGQLLAGTADRLPSLVFSLVEKVLEGMQFDGPMLESAIANLLAEMQPAEGERVEVRLNPQDLERLTEHLENAGTLNLNYLDLRDDDRLRPGDMTVHSRFGLVDARLDTRLARLWKEIHAG